MIRIPDPFLHVEQPWNVPFRPLIGLRAALDDTIRGNSYLAGTLLTDAEMCSGLRAIGRYFEALRTFEAPDQEWIESAFPPPPREDDGSIRSRNQLPIYHAAGTIDFRIGLFSEISEDVVTTCLARHIPDYQPWSALAYQTYLVWLAKQLYWNPRIILDSLISVCVRGNPSDAVAQLCIELIENNWRDCPPDTNEFGTFNHDTQPWIAVLSVANIAGHIVLPVLEQIIDESPVEFMREMATSHRHNLRN